ncbi:MAG: hypothetical protein H0W88_04710 [Parachlamydiaceae bacterium]|nr:hypothetical protein [Parachlamydiaceae bacterium]
MVCFSSIKLWGTELTTLCMHDGKMLFYVATSPNKSTSAGYTINKIKKVNVELRECNHDTITSEEHFLDLVKKGLIVSITKDQKFKLFSKVDKASKEKLFCLTKGKDDTTNIKATQCSVIKKKVEQKAKEQFAILATHFKKDAEKVESKSVAALETRAVLNQPKQSSKSSQPKPEREQPKKVESELADVQAMSRSFAASLSLQPTYGTTGLVSRVESQQLERKQPPLEKKEEKRHLDSSAGHTSVAVSTHNISSTHSAQKKEKNEEESTPVVKIREKEFLSLKDGSFVIMGTIKTTIFLLNQYQNSQDYNQKQKKILELTQQNKTLDTNSELFKQNQSLIKALEEQVAPTKHLLEALQKTIDDHSKVYIKVHSPDFHGWPTIFVPPNTMLMLPTCYHVHIGEKGILSEMSISSRNTKATYKNIKCFATTNLEELIKSFEEDYVKREGLNTLLKKAKEETISLRNDMMTEYNRGNLAIGWLRQIQDERQKLKRELAEIRKNFPTLNSNVLVEQRIALYLEYQKLDSLSKKIKADEAFIEAAQKDAENPQDLTTKRQDLEIQKKAEAALTLEDNKQTTLFVTSYGQMERIKEIEEQLLKLKKRMEDIQENVKIYKDYYRVRVVYINQRYKAILIVEEDLLLTSSAAFKECADKKLGTIPQLPYNIDCPVKGQYTHTFYHTRCVIVSNRVLEAISDTEYVNRNDEFEAVIATAKKNEEERKNEMRLKQRAEEKQRLLKAKKDEECCGIM